MHSDLKQWSSLPGMIGKSQASLFSDVVLASQSILKKIKATNLSCHIFGNMFHEV